MEIQKMCMALGALKVFVSSSIYVSLPEFWKHCISVAMATRILSKLSGFKSVAQNDAFTAGLFHDIGILLFDQFFAKEYLLVRKARPPDELAQHKKEKELWSISACQ